MVCFLLFAQQEDMCLFISQLAWCFYSHLMSKMFGQLEVICNTCQANGFTHQGWIAWSWENMYMPRTLTQLCCLGLGQIPPTGTTAVCRGILLMAIWAAKGLYSSPVVLVGLQKHLHSLSALMMLCAACLHGFGKAIFESKFWFCPV